MRATNCAVDQKLDVPLKQQTSHVCNERRSMIQRRLLIAVTHYASMFPSASILIFTCSRIRPVCSGTFPTHGAGSKQCLADLIKPTLEQYYDDTMQTVYYRLALMQIRYNTCVQHSQAFQYIQYVRREIRLNWSRPNENYRAHWSYVFLRGLKVKKRNEK